MNHLSVNVDVPEDVAMVCSNSIGVELKSEDLSKSTVRLSGSGRGLEFDVFADDLHTLRAAVNTHLRWVIMCLRLMNAG